MTTIERIGLDLWPRRRKYLIRRALRAADGQIIRISIGEAETLARQETEREVAKRLKFFDLMDGSQIRPKQVATIKRIDPVT